MLEKYFEYRKHKTNFKTEVIAGVTTFLTMAYIMFLNPFILSGEFAGPEKGFFDFGAVFTATIVATALACFIMAFYGKTWPIGLAPGMGLNAFFTYTVVGEMGYTWEIALGAVFLAGILFWIMSVTPIRQWMLESIPMNLRIAMGSGVGLFIGFIGLKNGGIIVSNDATLISIGDLLKVETLLAMLGFLLIAILAVRRIPGAILIGVMMVTLISIFVGIIQFQGLISYPPAFMPVFMKLDILGALDLAMISVIMSFLFVNLFDTAGTLLGVANQAKLADENGNIHNLDKALKADSSSSAFGAFLGCAPVTSYVESSAGVEAGGRTGLTAVTVGFLFLIAVFFSPLASIIPAHATAGALIYVAILMMSGMEKLNWSDSSELLPALIIIVMIPLTFSIANGIALGFISYVVLKIASGQFKKISLGAWFLTMIFLSKFLFL